MARICPANADDGCGTLVLCDLKCDLALAFGTKLAAYDDGDRHGSSWWQRSLTKLTTALSRSLIVPELPTVTVARPESLSISASTGCLSASLNDSSPCEFSV